MMRIAAAYKFDSLRFPSQEICSRSAAGRGEMAAPVAIVTSELLGECDHSSTGIPACANVTMRRDRRCLKRARDCVLCLLMCVQSPRLQVRNNDAGVPRLRECLLAAACGAG